MTKSVVSLGLLTVLTVFTGCMCSPYGGMGVPHNGYGYNPHGYGPAAAVSSCGDCGGCEVGNPCEVAACGVGYGNIGYGRPVATVATIATTPISLLGRLFNYGYYPDGGCGPLYLGECNQACSPCDTTGEYIGHNGCGVGVGCASYPANGTCAVNYGPGGCTDPTVCGPTSKMFGDKLVPNFSETPMQYQFQRICPQICAVPFFGFGYGSGYSPYGGYGGYPSYGRGQGGPTMGRPMTTGGEYVEEIEEGGDVIQPPHVGAVSYPAARTQRSVVAGSAQFLPPSLPSTAKSGVVSVRPAPVVAVSSKPTPVVAQKPAVFLPKTPTTGAAPVQFASQTPPRSGSSSNGTTGMNGNTGNGSRVSAVVPANHSESAATVAKPSAVVPVQWKATKPEVRLPRKPNPQVVAEVESLELPPQTQIIGTRFSQR